MKKQLFLLTAVFAALGVAAQNSIPNGNFEQWNSGTYESPQNYPFTTNPETFFGCQVPFNVIKTTDAYSGSYAVQMTTLAGVTDTCVGGIVNVPNPGDNFPNWPGGFPYNQKPTGMRGYYKSSLTAGDTAFVLAIFKLGGISIWAYMDTIVGTQSTYTLFSLIFNPPLPLNPDTVIFAAISGNLEGVPVRRVLRDRQASCSNVRYLLI